MEVEKGGIQGVGVEAYHFALHCKVASFDYNTCCTCFINTFDFVVDLGPYFSGQTVVLKVYDCQNLLAVAVVADDVFFILFYHDYMVLIQNLLYV